MAVNYSRHITVNDLSKRALVASAEIPAILEPLHRSYHRRHASRGARCHGRCSVWDFMCTQTHMGTSHPHPAYTFCCLIGPLFRLDALALSVIATATWLAGWLAGCLSQPVLYQND